MITVTVNKDDNGITLKQYRATYCMYTTVNCKYREVFSIVNSGLSIDRDTIMAVSLSPSVSTLF